MNATLGDGALLTKKSLSLKDAKKIAAGAAAEARKNKWNLDHGMSSLARRQSREQPPHEIPFPPRKNELFARGLRSIRFSL